MTTTVMVVTGNVPVRIRGEGPQAQIVVNEELPAGCTRTYYAHAGCAITVTEIHPKAEGELQLSAVSQSEVPPA